MSTLDARLLADARDRLREHARDLIDPQTADVVRDDGTVTRHVGPSLLAQLRAAVATGNEVSVGVRGRGRPLVIVAGAYDLLAAITADVGTWPWAERGPLDDRIRASVAALCRSVDLDAITTVSRHLARWAAEIRGLLTPDRRRHLAAPCPECGARMTWTYDPNMGERVQVHALQVARTGADGALQCTCLACGTVWPESRFELLARVLS